MAMRYKSFTWPNDPRTYTLSCQRQTALHKIPMGGFVVQDLGRTGTVMRGEGEFFGAGAYDTFRRLLQVFRQQGPGLLLHPMWQTGSAYFTRLQLTQEPRSNYVAYAFEFCEASGGAQRASGAQAKGYYVMQEADTLWSVAQRYDLRMRELLAMNPEIANPNHVRAGQKVRIA